VLSNLNLDVEELLRFAQRRLTNNEEEDDDDLLLGWKITISGLDATNMVSLVNVAIETSGTTSVYVSAPTSEITVVAEAPNHEVTTVKLVFDDAPFSIIHNPQGGMKVTLNHLHLKSLDLTKAQQTGVPLHLKMFNIKDLTVNFVQGEKISISWLTMAVYVLSNDKGKSEEVLLDEATVIGMPLRANGEHHGFEITKDHITVTGYLIGSTITEVLLMKHDVGFSMQRVTLAAVPAPPSPPACSDYQGFVVGGESKVRERVTAIKEGKGEVEVPQDSFMKTVTGLALNLDTVKEKACAQVSVLSVLFKFIGEVSKDAPPVKIIPDDKLTRRVLAFDKTGIVSFSLDNGMLSVGLSLSSVGITEHKHPFPSNLWMPFNPTTTISWATHKSAVETNSQQNAYVTLEFVSFVETTSPVKPPADPTKILLTVADVANVKGASEISFKSPDKPNVCVWYSKYGAATTTPSMEGIVHLKFEHLVDLLTVEHNPHTSMKVKLPKGFVATFGKSFMPAVGEITVTTGV